LTAETPARLESRPQKTVPAESAESLIDFAAEMFHFLVQVPGRHIVLLVLDLA
jgi:hypothetical protein